MQLEHISDGVARFLGEHSSSQGLRDLQHFLHNEGVLELDALTHSLVFNQELLANLVNMMSIPERSQTLHMLAKRFEKLQLESLENLKYAAYFHKLTGDEISMFQLLLYYFESYQWQKISKRSNLIHYLHILQGQIHRRALEKKDYHYFALRSQVHILQIQYHLAFGNIIQEDSLQKLGISRESKGVHSAREQNYLKSNPQQQTAYETLEKAKEILSQSQYLYFLTQIIFLLDQRHYKIEAFLANSFENLDPEEVYAIRILKAKIYRKKKDFSSAMEEVFFNFFHLLEETIQFLLETLIRLIEDVHAGRKVHSSREKLCSFMEKLFSLLLESLESKPWAHHQYNYQKQKCKAMGLTLQKVTALLQQNTKKGEEEDNQYFREEALYQILKMEKMNEIPEFNKPLHQNILALFHILLNSDNPYLKKNSTEALFEGIPIVLDALENLESPLISWREIKADIQRCWGKWFLRQNDLEKADHFFHQSLSTIPDHNILLRNEVMQEWGVWS